MAKKTDKKPLLSSLSLDDKNFNKHTPAGLALLENSVKTVGVIESITVSADNKIISGNARRDKISAVLGDVEPIIVETDGTQPVVIRRTDIASGSRQFYEAALLANTVPQQNIDLDLDLIQNVAIDDFGIDVAGLGIDLSALDDDADADNAGVSKGFHGGWGSDKGDKSEALCDFTDKIELHKKGLFYFVSVWRRTETGTSIADAKHDPAMIELFANKALELIPQLWGANFADGGWCIVTSPKRRNKEANFASAVCARVAEVLLIPFYDDAIICRTKMRINPEFTVVKHIAEPNVLVYDDILTTGSTLTAVFNVLRKKNCVFLVGINNN
jgi:hypothetical protein